MNREEEYTKNRMFSDDNIQKQMDILKNLIADEINIDVSSPEEDMVKGNDVNIIIKRKNLILGGVGLRLRNIDKRYNGIQYVEATFRAFTTIGHDTEYQKLKTNNVTHYLFSYMEKGNIIKYAFLDITKMRKDGWFNKLATEVGIKYNLDGTGFVYYNYYELRNYVIESKGIDLVSEIKKYTL